MAMKSATTARRRRAWAAALVAATVAATATAACTAREAEDALHAAGKIAYDSMKARQESH